jgi:multicomponent K+:H+ antiporter subunit G
MAGYFVKWGSVCACFSVRVGRFSVPGTSFYQRVHATTLGTTLGMGCVLIASMLFFSVRETRFVIHELLIAAVMVVTTPISLMLLVRATLYRDRREGSPEVPPPD